MNPATSAYLTRLFSRYPQNLGIEIRPINIETGEASCLFFTSRPESLIRCAAKCEELLPLHEVYIGVLPRLGRGTEDRDVPLTKWLWVDLDAGESEGAHIAQMLADVRINDQPLPRPSLIVHSGSGGVHLYWELPEFHPLTDSEERRTFSGVLRRLCLAIGGRAPFAHADTSCVNPSRILRVPGTLNHKWNPARDVLLQIPDQPDIRPFLWWRAHLPAEPERIFQRAALHEGSGWGVAPGLQRWASEGYPEGRRHKDLVGAAKFIKVDCQLPDQRGWELFVQKAVNSAGRRHLTDRELEGIWQWA